MLTHQRKAMILTALQRNGQVVAKDIAQTLDLSEDTIRRDLREMAADGLLLRVHGGAVPASPAMADLSVKRTQSPDAKRALGLRAAALIRPGQLVFVDGGTTCLELVRHLPFDLSATIVTHSPLIASALINHRGVEVVQIGGRLFKHSGVCVGAMVIDAVARFRADMFFMGVTGVHADFGLSTGDMEEAAVKHALAASSAETIVMATDAKVGAVSPHIILPAQSMGLLLAAGVEDAALAPFRALGIAVERVGAA